MDGASLDKLRKIAGMLGSEHAGERAAAALKGTALLKAAGLSWGQIDLGRATTLHENKEDAQVRLLRMMYESECSRTTRLILENNQLKREVDRLKGMWKNGDPPQPAPATSAAVDNKPLRRKIAAVVEAAAAGKLDLSNLELQLFSVLMKKPNWTTDDKHAARMGLSAVHARTGG